jgi:hypothetical protein
MTDNIQNPIADDTSRTDSSSEEQDPRGPVPALSPPDNGGRSPTRPSTSAVCAGSQQETEDEHETPAALNSYEAKQEARRQRLLRASASAAGEAEALHGRAQSMASVIPMGQPILVGHHSEGRDRRYRARFGRLYEKSFEAQKQAEELRIRAAAVGTGGISSDDPDAVTKLRDQLTTIQGSIARMKAVNSAHKRYLKTPATLDAAPISDADKARCRGYKQAYSWEPHPFAPFEISNAGANARRIQKRIEVLEARDASPAREPRIGDGWQIEEDAADNRIAITFDEIPSRDQRDRLKSHGFRWSPTRGAWVRQRNNGAWAAACYVMGVQ